MSREYDNYLTEHRANVAKGLDWLRYNLPDTVSSTDFAFTYRPWGHDQSKNDREEYYAYDDYFYGRRTKAVEEEFNYAWLHHIHNNPHHWQYWVLVNDDPEEGTIGLRMPYKYVIEMICDWWAFSWAKDNLYEIFDWYDNHKAHMVLHENTRELVEEILGKIKAKLDEANEESVKKSE